MDEGVLGGVGCPDDSGGSKRENGGELHFEMVDVVVLWIRFVICE